MKIVQVSSLFLLILIVRCNGMPRFANTLGSHMVLQRAPQKSIVWGFGDSSTLTTLTLNNKVYTTISQSEIANEKGESIWSVTLDPVSDEGPFDIHVSQPLTNGTLVTITLNDILFGDVWLCSGQSNMEMSVIQIFNGSEEIANAGNYPKIRVFSAARNYSATPLEELIRIYLNWSVASPQSIGGPPMEYMSAVCWLYGRMIHQALGGRPIGLIDTSYYGVDIQTWMPPKALQDCNATMNEDTRTPSYDVSSIGDVIPNNFSCLFNSMLYPFTRTVIYGVAWYQGEANGASRTDNSYVCYFSKLIESWREIWNQRTNGITNIQFPFGFVQIGTETNSSIPIGGKTWIRWRQTFNVGYVPNNVVPNVFMAISLDLRDDPNGVHSRHKLDVSYRLSRSCLAVAYGQQVEFRGPIVENVDYTNGSETVNITYTAVSSIELRNPNGFEVCCLGNQCLDDYIWVPSIISNKDGLTVTVKVNSSCIGQPLYGIRYLWHETPCLFKQASLYSGTDSNLPAPPYIKIF